MLQESFSKDKRNLRSILLSADFVVVGGGISGICAAVSAARAGVKTILVQDRPVLGGNASSEVRLWILGATSHMGNNNRWSREGGLIDEILVDNLYRNKEGNPVLLDTLLLEKVRNEPNITLLLNTAVYDVEKRSLMKYPKYTVSVHRIILSMKSVADSFVTLRAMVLLRIGLGLLSRMGLKKNKYMVNYSLRIKENMVNCLDTLSTSIVKIQENL